MRKLVVVVATVLALMTLPVAGVAAKQPKLPTYKPMTQLPASLTSEVQPKSALKSTTSAKSADGGSPDYAPLPGTTVTGLLYDDLNGYFLSNYTIAAVGQHIEVWVQNNLAFPAGDPRATPVVTEAQVAYLVDQFDNNIYPKESEFWRTPETRVGENNAVLPPGFWAPTDGKDRTIAMISNIRDANYYDPTFPVYIAGFYSPTIRDFMDRNVISIDAYDWGNRVGPPGSPWRPNDGTANDQD